MNKKMMSLGFFLFGLVVSVQAVDEVAFVDLTQLFSRFYKTRLADTQLKATLLEIDVENKVLLEEFREFQTKYDQLRIEAKDKSLSMDLREQKRIDAEETLLEMQDKESTIKGFQQRHRSQLESQRSRMRTRILEEIRNVIENEAHLKAYSCVINSSSMDASNSNVILFHATRFDITEDILVKLNKGHADTFKDIEKTEEPKTETVK